MKDSDITQTEDNEPQEIHYAVSTTKLYVMSVFTFGLYMWYWYYKNWEIERNRTNEDISPFWRAVFCLFYTHSLYDRFDWRARERQLNLSWNPDSLATITVILIFLDGFIERICSNTVGIGVLDYISLLMGFIVIIPIAQAQKIVNQVNNDPGGRLNAKFSSSNILLIILAGLIWTLSFTISFFAHLLSPSV